MMILMLILMLTLMLILMLMRMPMMQKQCTQIFIKLPQTSAGVGMCAASFTLWPTRPAAGWAQLCTTAPLVTRWKMLPIAWELKELLVLA